MVASRMQAMGDAVGSSLSAPESLLTIDKLSALSAGAMAMVQRGVPTEQVMRRY